MGMVTVVVMLDRHVSDAIQADVVEQALQGGQGDGPILSVAGGVNRNVSQAINSLVNEHVFPCHMIQSFYILFE